MPTLSGGRQEQPQEVGSRGQDGRLPHVRIDLDGAGRVITVQGPRAAKPQGKAKEIRASAIASLLDMRAVDSVVSQTTGQQQARVSLSWDNDLARWLRRHTDYTGEGCLVIHGDYSGADGETSGGLSGGLVSIKGPPSRQAEARVRITISSIGHGVDSAPIRNRFIRSPWEISVIEQIAHSVAHEIRNPLAAIRGLTQLTILCKPEKKDEYSQAILREIDRLDSIVEEFLALSNRPTTRWQRIRANDIIDEVVFLLNGRLLLQKVSVQVREEEEGVPVPWVKPELIRQALLHLFSTILSACRDDAVVVVNISYEEDADAVCIKITEDVRARDRCPETGDRGHRWQDDFWFTFTGEDDRSALGLSVAHRAVQHHGGSIEAVYKESDGTAVLITIPVNPTQQLQEEEGAANDTPDDRG